MRVLPENLREKLKEPIGKLVDEKTLLKLLKDEKYIISIGDMVTYTLLKNDIEPSICVVDFILERKKYEKEMMDKIKNFGEKIVKVKNPAGAITDGLWDAIDKSIKNMSEKKYRIEVDGEEDLASLVAIYLAPTYATVIYGLPDKGVLLVKANQVHKAKVEEILNKM